MADNDKKYLSKIVKGGQTLHIKDAEAQANIAQVASEKADKSSTYTKTEVDTKFDEFEGPVYDETNHGFDFPSSAKMSYDSVNHGFVFG